MKNNYLMVVLAGSWLAAGNFVQAVVPIDPTDHSKDKPVTITVVNKLPSAVKVVATRRVDGQFYPCESVTRSNSRMPGVQKRILGDSCSITSFKSGEKIPVTVKEVPHVRARTGKKDLDILVYDGLKKIGKKTGIKGGKTVTIELTKAGKNALNNNDFKLIEENIKITSSLF